MLTAGALCGSLQALVRKGREVTVMEFKDVLVVLAAVMLLAIFLDRVILNPRLVIATSAQQTDTSQP